MLIEEDKRFYFCIEDKDQGRRIDVFLACHVEDLTRSRVQDLIKGDSVSVNDRPAKTSYRLRAGDHVEMSLPPLRPPHVEPQHVDFTPVYEDASLLVLNKPPGLVVHPAPGHANGTLVHGLLHYCRDLSGIGGILRPGIVHRLDKDTSGLIVVAKNDRVHNALSRQFKEGTITKRYLAVVHGIMRGERGEIDSPIARHPKRRKEMSVVASGGKRALTFWRKIRTFGDGFSLLQVSPKTGRTHQIRVHLSSVGHPISGDAVYGHGRNWWKNHLPAPVRNLPPPARQMLHAETLGFIHPDTETYCEFKAPLPGDMDRMITALKGIYPDDHEEGVA